MTNLDELKSDLKEFIIAEFLPGEDVSNLHDDTPLISSRVLDSLAVLRLVEYIEAKHDFEIAPERMTEEYMDTVDSIARLVAEEK